MANPQYLPLRASGYISHKYADHVSILKFIERNWRLPPVTRRSRDNFPNPVQPQGSYAPVNSPALNDLFDFFDLPSSHGFFLAAHGVQSLRGPPDGGPFLSGAIHGRPLRFACRYPPVTRQVAG